MKKVSIVQSNCIPWKGYFDMISAMGEFILFDDMQYTRRDTRNRSQIKTLQSSRWLAVPALLKGTDHQKLRETRTEGTDGQRPIGRSCLRIPPGCAFRWNPRLAEIALSG
jgi:hypothetical protein